VLLTLGACGGGSRDFELTAPTGLPELKPGGEVDFTWTLSGGDGFLDIEITSLDGTHHTFLMNQEIPEGDGELPFTGLDMDAAGVPVDVYDVDVVAFDRLGGDVVDTVHGTMAVDGLRFTDPPAGMDVALGDPTYTIELRTVSLEPFDLTTSLGDHVIDTRHVNGELVPFQRQIFFDGTDTDGVVIPSGTYVVHADAANGIDVQVDGGSLTF
jgi:hypothetical protein